MNDSRLPNKAPEDDGAAFPVGVGADDPLAWEMIGAGRFMPRRIRGSFRGRVLG